MVAAFDSACRAVENHVGHGLVINGKLRLPGPVSEWIDWKSVIHPPKTPD
jgi:hypothetical protein